MNTVAYFEIQSSDPAKAAAFYSAIFGWTCAKQKMMPIEYYRITTPGMNGGILKRPAQTPPQECGTNAFTCSMQVADFDETTATITKHGGRVAMPKFAVPGKCWQGYFMDLDSNVFGIFQVDESAQC